MRSKALSLIAILALFLSACGGSSSEADSSAAVPAAIETTEDNADEAAIEQPSADEAAPGPEADGSSSDGQMDGQIRTISEQEQFIVGVFELEDTSLAVTSDQATSLIQLWNSMLELTQRQPQAGSQETDEVVQPEEPLDNSEEIATLFEEIQSVMTDEQLQAISALELDLNAITVFMEEQGIELGNGMQPGQGDQTPPEGIPSDEEMSAPEGTSPADAQGDNSGDPGDKGPDGQSPANGSEGQPQGEGGMGSGCGGFIQTASSNLIEALIELLESKISS